MSTFQVRWTASPCNTHRLGLGTCSLAAAGVPRVSLVPIAQTHLSSLALLLPVLYTGDCDAELEALKLRCMQLLQPYIAGYIWQHGPLSLQSSLQQQPPWASANSKGTGAVPELCWVLQKHQCFLHA